MYSGIYPPANNGSNLIRYYNGKNIWYTSSQFSPQLQRNKALSSNEHLERFNASTFPSVRQDEYDGFLYEDSDMANRGYVAKPGICLANPVNQMVNNGDIDLVKPVSHVVNTCSQIVNHGGRDIGTPDSHVVNTDSQMVNGTRHMDNAENHTVTTNNQMANTDCIRIRQDRHIRVDEMFTENSQSNSGSTITAHDIRYTVDVRSNMCFGRSKMKDILKGIDCMFLPGLNAIMGPTESGKSSFLDILAGRKDSDDLSGKLLLDGLPPPENFKSMIGYVVQNDVVMGTLTVREHLEFSAALKLPSSVESDERRKIVENIIQELGLHHCADTKVGNEVIPGVSRGERKRTCIGMELIMSPKVLLLDEPTTGLDANSASTVMLLLKGLSLKGTTIVFSIHKPRFSIYRLFDHLVLLSHGETVYHGPAVNALDHFHNIGYDIQEHNNPPDFFLDIINGDISTFYDNNANKCDMLSEIAERLEHEEVDRVYDLVHTKLIDGYKKSPICSKLQNTLKNIMSDYEKKTREETDILKPTSTAYTTGFCRQFVIIAVRTLKNKLRSPIGFISQVFVMVIFACLVGAVYWQIESDCKSGLQNRVGGLCFILMFLTFTNLSAIELFISERTIFMHESSSGMYRVSSYFFAFIICDVIPNRLVPDIIFTVIAYFMIGFEKDVEKFFFFLLTIFMVSMAGAGVAYFFSSVIGVFAVTHLCVATIFVVMLVFGGVFVNTDSIPDWLEWIKWLSIFRYGLKALVINELKNFKFYNSSGVQCAPSGNAYLKSQGIPFDTAWDKWQNIVALGVISLVFLLLAFIMMLRIKKLK